MTCLEPSILGNFSKLQRYWSTLRTRRIPFGKALNLKTRPIHEGDIRKIAKIIHPSHGRTLLDELEDQKKGLISIVVTWANNIPSGYSFVSWKGARDPDIRSRLPNVPEFYRLTVLESARSRGIGTALIRFIETMARDRGFTKMGLGVTHANSRAHALYQRLGYHEVVEEYFDRYPYLDQDGQLREAADKCRFMVKNLNE